MTQYWAMALHESCLFLPCQWLSWLQALLKHLHRGLWPPRFPPCLWQCHGPPTTAVSTITQCCNATHCYVSLSSVYIYFQKSMIWMNNSGHTLDFAVDPRFQKCKTIDLIIRNILCGGPIFLFQIVVVIVLDIAFRFRRVSGILYPSKWLGKHFSLRK